MHYVCRTLSYTLLLFFFLKGFSFWRSHCPLAAVAPNSTSLCSQNLNSTQVTQTGKTKQTLRNVQARLLFFLLERGWVRHNAECCINDSVGPCCFWRAAVRWNRGASVRVEKCREDQRRTGLVADMETDLRRWGCGMCVSPSWKTQETACACCGAPKAVWALQAVKRLAHRCHRVKIFLYDFFIYVWNV